MDSTFGNVFLFLTDLAWKSRLTIPVLVTTAFLVMDIRLQIEINIESGQVTASELDEADYAFEAEIGNDGEGEDSESDLYTDDLEEYNSEFTIDDGSETSHYSLDIYDHWGSDWEIDDEIQQ
ncbi:uncharacterized protein [Drosophila tropicalis]|uniref:uncharacterized protein n=1 Tax=Drosophila tropicalis TaxID=46794 RepID=UPI0035AB8C54